ncbi:MAG: YCF48-related protein [candidate division Zixibacteria bacterium]|nr:YCF48-related protein [candidate division Zixibacteria bacterium]
MSVKKSATAITLGVILLLSGVAFSKSAWRRVDSGTQYFMKSISAPDSLHVWVTGSGRVLRSTDGGLSWSIQFNSPSVGFDIVRFVDSLHGWGLGAFCCYVSVVYRTVDGGSTWNQVNFPPTIQPIRAASFVDTLNGWAAADGDTIYRTTNGGLSWTPHFVGESSFIPFQIQFVDSLRGWVAGSKFTGNEYPRIFHSSDGGRNWVMQSLNLADTGGYVKDIDFIDGNIGWLLTAVAGERIYRTTDGGVTWAVMYGEAGGPIRKALDFIDDSRGWMAGTTFFGGFVSTIGHSIDSGKSFVDTVIQEGGDAQKIKMFNENIGWAVDDAGGVLLYAPPTLGDVNWDGNFTSADVVLEINKVFLEEPFPAPAEAGDVNCDSRFSAADVVWLLQAIFMERPFPCSIASQTDLANLS